MDTSLHPQWGRTIGSYSLPSDMNRTTLSVDSELTGLQAMQKISQLATEGRIQGRESLEENIDIKMLHCALNLASDPATIRQLANPPIISGCICLMKTISRQHPRATSLLVGALNLCLLERWGTLDATLATVKDYPDPRGSPQIITSVKVAGTIMNQFTGMNIGADFDSALGWSTSTNNRRQAPLLSRLDMSTLFDLMWNDRKLFLQALVNDISTSCGLSGLFCCFSRYVARAREFRQGPDDESLKFRLFELGSRYSLVAPEYQREAMMFVMSTTNCSQKWNNTPKHVDAEDSRLMMSSYIKQLSDNRDPILIARDPSINPTFISLVTDAQTQDLLPEVMKCTIKYGWFALLDEEEADKLEGLNDIIFGGLWWLFQPPHNRPYRLKEITQTQLIDAMHGGDFLDWVACILTRLGPASRTSAFYLP
ncbi:unnamed protein product [Rhizoctonia solani]|uniref:Uncharacterized protein n=1 Tax=Rhizoctonia solani TaxID=456999 RepID=A0A8H3HCA1_9AGAM|nr:unnamed protein product [Rhizoctonia solani]